jgi:hypothetical protein
VIERMNRRVSLTPRKHRALIVATEGEAA